MRKFFKLIIFLSLFIASDVLAQAETATESLSKRYVFVTGFNDYPPFGEWDDAQKVFTTAFDNFIKAYAKERGFLIIYTFKVKEYTELVREVRRGNVDMILGIYNETDTYTGLDYLYPAFVTNPIRVIMLPNRINEVSGADDLKKLKGGVNSREHFSDYINREIAKFDVVKVDNSYELFEKLFKGEIDYIFSGYYFGIIESAKLGLRQKITFSKQVIWEIPMFIGLSKVSDKRNFLMGSLNVYMRGKNIKDVLKKSIEKEVYKYEERYIGVVPPSYSLHIPDENEKIEDEERWKPLTSD